MSCSCGKVVCPHAENSWNRGHNHFFCCVSGLYSLYLIHLSNSSWFILQVNHTKRELHNVFIRKLYRYRPSSFGHLVAIFFIASVSYGFWNQKKIMHLSLAGEQRLYLNFMVFFSKQRESFWRHAEGAWRYSRQKETNTRNASNSGTSL